MGSLSLSDFTADITECKQLLQNKCLCYKAHSVRFRLKHVTKTLISSLELQYYHYYYYCIINIIIINIIINIIIIIIIITTIIIIILLSILLFLNSHL